MADTVAQTFAEYRSKLLKFIRSRLRSFVWDAIKNALDELPQAQRDIFIQTEFEGLPAKEIAEKTGVPVNTLLSKKHYAVKYLREKLWEIYAELSSSSTSS